MDFYQFVVALIVALPPLLVSVVTLIRLFHVESKVQDVHLMVNSRLDQLVAATTAASIAVGRSQILAEQLASTDADAHATARGIVLGRQLALNEMPKKSDPPINT